MDERDYKAMNDELQQSGNLQWQPTKREYFAAAAMQGILSNSRAPEFDYDHVAEASVRFADAINKKLEEIDEDEA